MLLIEDDAETAGYVASGLCEEGHLIAQAADGKEALVLAMSELYDLLIVDRMIPGLDGLKLVRTLRSAGYVGDMAQALQRCLDLVEHGVQADHQVIELVISPADRDTA